MKKVIGITGGIASGKSNIVNVIENEGYKVLSCDKIYQELSEIGMPIYNNILNTFGDSFILPNRKLDKKKLGKLIFNNEDKKILLNSITHPVIKDVLINEINKSSEEYIFIEIPLLYEAKFDDLCDFIIVAYLPKDEQIKRLMERDMIDYNYALAKISSQDSLDDKKAKANFVINTIGTFDETKKEVLQVLNKIRGE